MRVRVSHFACLLLLLSTFGVAGAAASHTNVRFRSQFITALLRQETAGTRPSVAADRSLKLVAKAPAGAAMGRRRTAMPMQPPAAQTIGVFAVTASGL